MYPGFRTVYPGFRTMYPGFKSVYPNTAKTSESSAESGAIGSKKPGNQTQTCDNESWTPESQYFFVVPQTKFFGVCDSRHFLSYPKMATAKKSLQRQNGLCVSQLNLCVPENHRSLVNCKNQRFSKPELEAKIRPVGQSRFVVPRATTYPNSLTATQDFAIENNSIWLAPIFMINQPLCASPHKCRTLSLRLLSPRT